MDRYVLVKEIGQGSFGIVHQARKVEDGTIVAMKKILKIHRNDTELKNLTHECDIQRNLKHPNIIQILDAFETPDCMVIITEYAQQGDLTRLINNANGNGLPIPTVKRITCDLVCALNYLFNQRILHRDLKPQNILVGSDGLCKLCDFGFAKTIGINDFLLTSFKGTPLYMAPEIFTHCPYDQKAELWSLGCIIYELLMGKPPFYTNSLSELTIMIYAADINFKAEVFVGDCGSFVKGLLKKNPDSRLPWDQILGHPFIRDQLNIDNTRGEFSLAKVLSPHEEVLRNKQKQTIQKKMHAYLRLMLKTQKKMQKAQKQLETCIPDAKTIHTPTHITNTGQNSRFPQHEYPAIVGRPKVSPIANKNAEYTDYPDNKSDSSCETLTSSEDDNTDSEEDIRTIVNGSGNIDYQNDDSNNTQTNITNGETGGLKPGNMFWKSDALFTLHSLGLDDKPIQSEEWIHFLITTIKEVLDNPQCICEKHFITVLIGPLRNHLTSPDVIEKIADVLGVPFTMEEFPEGLVSPLQSMYLDSKVLPNLLYAVKVIIRRRGIANNSKELEGIVNFLTKEDLSALNKCIRLVCFLIYLDEDYVIQFCDSLCVLQLFPTLLLLLKLDSKNVSFTGDILAILCQLMRADPSNVWIVEELFFGDCQIARNVDELWRLLRHSEPRIKSRALRLLTYLAVNCSRAVDKFIRSNVLKLWKCVKSANESEVPELQEAANFVSKNIKLLSTEEFQSLRHIQQENKILSASHDDEEIILSQNVESANPLQIASDESR